MCKSCCIQNTLMQEDAGNLIHCPLHKVSKLQFNTTNHNKKTFEGTLEWQSKELNDSKTTPEDVFASAEQRRKGGQSQLPLASKTILAGGFLFHSPSVKRFAQHSKIPENELLDLAITFLEKVKLRQLTKLFDKVRLQNT